MGRIFLGSKELAFRQLLSHFAYRTMILYRTDHGNCLGRFKRGPTDEPVSGEEETMAGAKDDIKEFEIGQKGCIIDREFVWMDCPVSPRRGERFFEISWDNANLNGSLGHEDGRPLGPQWM